MQHLIRRNHSLVATRFIAIPTAGPIMHQANDFLILFAEKTLSISWGIVIFFVLLGLAVTLSPPKRTYEVKRPKNE
jgi:hypothetical protein